jgi:ferric-dicitrate binding protein FerR (iron transport regulator)
MNLYYNTDQASRFASMWLLPALVKREQRGNWPPRELSQEEKQLRDLVAEDFRRWRPETILVDESPRKRAIDGDFDYLAWFERDPTLADMLMRYRRVGQLSDLRGRMEFGVYMAASPPGG